MIPYSHLFDQTILAQLIQHDAVVQRYHAFFSLIDWSPFDHVQQFLPLNRRPAHPDHAYIKAFLIKIVEGKPFMTQLRTFLVEHPLLIIELGFRLHLDPSQPYGFDIEKTVPRETLAQYQTPYA